MLKYCLVFLSTKCYDVSYGEIYVLAKFHSGMSYSAVGCEVNELMKP